MTVHATQASFDLTLARPVVSSGGEHAALVHLWWRADLDAAHLVQVYVDGALYDVTDRSQEHQMWLMLERSRPHRIELLAVPVAEAWQAQPGKLGNWDPAVRESVELAVLRDERLTVDTQVGVQSDDQVLDVAPLWPSDAHRGGFGALFGQGGFGFDAATGPGLGAGALGYGPLGADGDAWRWRRHDLAPGEHALVVEAHDTAGEVTAEPLTLEVSINHLPPPPRNLAIDEAFTLRWG